MNFKSFTKGGMAAVMAMSLAACSSSSSASATADGAFKLGISGPLTGDAAVYGKAVENAVNLAVEEVNAAGKVKLAFKMEDDQASGDMAVTAYNNLADWGMQISLGTVTSGAGQAVSPTLKQDNIFALTPSASSTGVVLADTKDTSSYFGNVFQMCFTDPNQGSASAVYMSEHFEGKKVGVIYRNDDNYSTGVYQTFVDKAEDLGIDIVSTQTFQDGATDFTVQVQQLAAAGSEVIFLPIYYQPATLILQAAKAQGVEATFFGSDGMDGILAQPGFDPALAEGLYMLTPFSADAKDEKTANFVKNYKEKFSDTPNQFAADAYDCVYAIAQAIEAGELTADMSTDDITAGLVKQFTSMTFNGITGTSVTWSENGEVTKAPKAIVVNNGVYVSAE